MAYVNFVWIYINFMVMNFLTRINMKYLTLSGNYMRCNFSNIIAFKKYKVVKANIF